MYNGYNLKLQNYSKITGIMKSLSTFDIQMFINIYKQLKNKNTENLL